MSSDQDNENINEESRARDPLMTQPLFEFDWLKDENQLRDEGVYFGLTSDEYPTDAFHDAGFSAHSLNLNLNERLWKFLRKQIASYYFYGHYAEFRQAILDFFQQLKKYKIGLEDLLTLKFRVISPA